MRILLVGILLLALAKNGLSLKCYECSTIESCENNPSQCTTNKKSCWKAEATVFGKKAVTKGCGLPKDAKTENHEDGCGQFTIDGIESNTCWCSSDLCNNSNVQMMSKLITFSLVFLAILTQLV